MWRRFRRGAGMALFLPLCMTCASSLSERKKAVQSERAPTCRECHEVISIGQPMVLEVVCRTCARGVRGEHPQTARSNTQCDRCGRFVRGKFTRKRDSDPVTIPHQETPRHPLEREALATVIDISANPPGEDTQNGSERPEIEAVTEPIADDVAPQDKPEAKTPREHVIVRNSELIPIKWPAQLVGRTTYLKTRDKSGPWEVVGPQLRWPTVSPSDDGYIRMYVRQMWAEGFKEVEEFSHWLELPPDDVFRLLREENLSLSDFRCSICRYRTHNRGACPENPYLSPEARRELREPL